MRRLRIPPGSRAEWVLTPLTVTGRVTDRLTGLLASFNAQLTEDHRGSPMSPVTAAAVQAALEFLDRELPPVPPAAELVGQR
jgi:hypothetical protein